jgi:drug/metabolite transporter (DMT)-like permease
MGRATSLDRRSHLALAAVILSNICLAGGPLLVRLAGSESGIGPVASAFWRVTLALPLLCLIARRGLGTIGGLGRSGLAILGVGGLFFAADLACWHLGILHTRLANAALFGNAAAFLFPIYGFIVARSRPKGAQLAGLLLALLGTMLLMGRSYELSSRNLVGDTLAILAGLFYVVYLVAIERVRGRMAPVPTLVATTAAGVLPLALFAVLLGEPLLPTGAWWPLVLLAIGSQVAGQGLLIFAVGHLAPLVVGLSLLLQPVIATAIGWTFYHERLDTLDLVGAVALCVALLLVRSTPRSARPLPETAGGRISRT